jgi:hypothetical protein
MAGTLRAHLYKPITDSAGDVITNIMVNFYMPGPFASEPTLIAAPVFAESSGTYTFEQPVEFATGVIDCYLDLPQRVLIGITPVGQSEFFLENQEFLAAGSNLVLAENQFIVTGTYSPGDVPTALSDGTVGWQPPPTAGEGGSGNGFDVDANNNMLAGEGTVVLTDAGTSGHSPGDAGESVIVGHQAQSGDQAVVIGGQSVQSGGDSLSEPESLTERATAAVRRVLGRHRKTPTTDTLVGGDTHGETGDETAGGQPFPSGEVLTPSTGSDRSVVVGNGSSAGDSGVALGWSSSSSASAVAVGAGAEASALGAVAIGYGAVANAEYTAAVSVQVLGVVLPAGLSGGTALSVVSPGGTTFYITVDDTGHLTTDTSPPDADDIVDHGDGTYTVSGPGVTDNGDGTFTEDDVTDNGDGTFTAS